MSDRFEAMRAFLAVSDASGFAAAARRLDVSPSVITRLVAGLEERLGVRLLHRTTRTVRLTEAGERFLARARRILQELEEAEMAALDERAQPRGRLVVSAPLLFGRMHVAPVISALLDAHPLVSVDLQLSDRFSSLIDEGVDVAVRIGKLPDSGLVARRLGQTRRLLVASPRYLERAAVPLNTPADLRSHRLIAFRSITSERSWTFRAPDGSAIDVDVEAYFATNSGQAAIDRALADGGITAALSYQVAAHLRSGALQTVLQAFAPEPVPIQAVFPTSRLLSSKVRGFLDLADAASATWHFELDA
jgi:DNA-binding transcriptional LysR family regulator